MNLTAVVTGGTQGIGKQVVKDLLERNYYVFTNYARDDKSAEIAGKEFKQISNDYEVIKADQGKKSDFIDFINRIKSKAVNIHCIVCNTAVTLKKEAMKISDDDWENVMQINVNSHFYLIRELYKLIPHNSRIVFIGSILGIIPHAISLPYGVSKAAVHALAKNLVKEFDNTGTTVNVVAPGFVETVWQKNKPVEIRENIYRKSAIKRFADVSEVSSAVMFCLDNQYVNGSIIEVTGGYGNIQ